MSTCTTLVLVVALAMSHGATSAEVASAANPIRKVVTMLQMMQNKVGAEGKAAEALFDKFMCYCQTGEASLKEQIASAEERIPQLEASLKEIAATHEQLKADLVAHKEDRAAAKEAIDTATALRAKEAKAYAEGAAESKANIAALEKAIPAIENGMAGFLQTGAATVLRQLSVSMEMSGTDRDMLTSFLSSSAEGAQEYAPQSGEIVGILKQMKDEMEKDLADLESEEAKQKASFESLVAAKQKQIEAATQAIEDKTTRVGNFAVEVANMKNEIEDLTEALAADKEFLANMGKACADKQKEWEAYKKTQAMELLALAETIKILNDDDALELFKKTLPEPAAAASFLQVRSTSESLRRSSALQTLAAARGGDRRMALLTMALRGRKAGFGAIIKMIDELVALLTKEQAADDKKMEWCEAELDKTEDEIKALERSVADLGKAIDDQKESISSAVSDIEALTKGIKDLDAQVVEATEQRKAEHADYTEELAANTAAKGLLGVAKNRMRKFYNPTLYTPPAKRELSEEDRITVNMGGTLAPTAAPGGIAGTGIAASFLQTATTSKELPPAPEADLTYKKKGEESNGVLAMIDSIVADVEKQIQEMEFAEKEAQKDYESFMSTSAAKRADDAKTISDKEGEKAALEEELQTTQESEKSTKLELMGTGKELQELHAECDWLMQNHELRKEARTGEIDALKKASAVLSGASYSF